MEVVHIPQYHLMKNLKLKRLKSQGQNTPGQGQSHQEEQSLRGLVLDQGLLENVDLPHHQVLTTRGNELILKFACLLLLYIQKLLLSFYCGKCD